MDLGGLCVLLLVPGSLYRRRSEDAVCIRFLRLPESRPPSLCLYLASLFVCLSLSVCLALPLSLSLCRSLSLSVSFSVCLCLALPLSLSVSISLSVFFCLCLALPLSLSLRLSLCLYLSLSLCLALPLSRSVSFCFLLSLSRPVRVCLHALWTRISFDTCNSAPTQLLTTSWTAAGHKSAHGSGGVAASASP